LNGPCYLAINKDDVETIEKLVVMKLVYVRKKDAKSVLKAEKRLAKLKVAADERGAGQWTHADGTLQQPHTPKSCTRATLHEWG